MRILILGLGRSGTCLLTEVVRGLGIVNFTEQLEDRAFFHKKKIVPENYGTKTTTEQPMFSMRNLLRTTNRYPDLHLIFSLRHPLDIFLSKIRRGQKPSDGGDGTVERISTDGMVETAIYYIRDFYNIYEFATKHYAGRIYSVKMENLILSPEQTVREVANYFHVLPTEKAFKFYEYDRNEYHHKRYNKQLDLSQVALYKRWDTIYDGFFKDRKDEVERAKEALNFIIKEFGYDD